MDLDDFSSAPEITLFLRDTVDAVSSRLTEYNVSLSAPETLWASVSWLINEAEQQATSPEVVVAETSIDDAALSIVSLLLAGIAEERPGTYPFAHDAQIPVPISAVMRTIHALAIIINLSVQNGRLHQVAYLTGAIGALSRIVAEEQILTDPDERTISSLDPDFTIEPPYCFMPQPGLAFCARVIEGVARDLREGSLTPSIDGELIDVVQLVSSLENDALGLRLLNRAFGVNPNSTES